MNVDSRFFESNASGYRGLCRLLADIQIQQSIQHATRLANKDGKDRKSPEIAVIDAKPHVASRVILTAFGADESHFTRETSCYGVLAAKHRLGDRWQIESAKTQCRVVGQHAGIGHEHRPVELATC